MKGVPWREEAGFTLVEILVAVAIIMIALVAVIQWFAIGTQGMDTGRKQSTAVFLGEQKLEQIKAWALSTQTAPVAQGFTTVTMAGTCRTFAGPPAGPCADNAFPPAPTAIPGYPEYSRTVCITNPTATTTLVRVLVQYRQLTGRGVTATPVALSCAVPPPATNQVPVELATLIAQH